MEEESKVKSLWKALPLKYKLITIGVAAGVIFIIIFLIILITPLMELGIIDIEGIGSSIGGVSSSIGYSSISNNASYWWPIGSDDTTIVNGLEFASGNPAETTITSNFGYRTDPFGGSSESNHQGMDIASGSGYGVTNVIAAKDGKVIYPKDDSPLYCVSNNRDESCGGGYGNYIMIQHSDSKVTVYAHLYEGSITVRAGDEVKQGQVIGKMGSSGSSTGNHLHFEVRDNGVKANPANFVSKDNPRPITASSNKQAVCMLLVNYGFSNNGVAALMTNISWESGFKTEALGDVDLGGSYGLCQWHGARWTNLMNAFPDTYNTVDSQVQFLIRELSASYYTDLYSSLLEGSKSASDLTYDFCNIFEVPVNHETSCWRRTSLTDTYLNYVQNGCQ